MPCHEKQYQEMRKIFAYISEISDMIKVASTPCKYLSSAWPNILTFTSPLSWSPSNLYYIGLHLVLWSGLTPTQCLYLTRLVLSIIFSMSKPIVLWIIISSQSFMLLQKEDKYICTYQPQPRSSVTYETMSSAWESISRKWNPWSIEESSK